MPGRLHEARQRPQSQRRVQIGRAQIDDAGGSRTILAATVYVALTFGAGLVLGVCRELLLRPAAGEVAALLIEAPVMLAVSFLAARWTVARFMPASRRDAHIAMGLVAFALLLGLEIAGSLLLRGLPFGAWLAQLATARGLISLALFVAFAAMPPLTAHLNAARRF